MLQKQENPKTDNSVEPMKLFINNEPITRMTPDTRKTGQIFFEK
jgi:hypothetical protein